MDIIRAATAGFCFGVDLALKRLDRLIEQVKDTTRIHTLGPIIHNPQVLARYARLGIGQASEPEDIPPGSHVVIRAHGIPKQYMEKLRLRDAHITDATCPKVRKAQILIARETGRGKTLLLFGEKNHPEVKGLLSHAMPDALVFESLDKLRSISLDPGRPYFLAAQTTQDRSAFRDVERHLHSVLDHDMTVLNTICDATSRRQEEAIAISREVDYMIIVGGFSSGNTRRLVKVAGSEGTACLQVETEAELPMADLQRYGRVGLTAGASTPKSVIDAVHYRLAAL